MSELRAAFPFISHLKITYHVTRKWVPTGRSDANGQELLQQIAERPGMEVEIIPFISDSEVSPPAPSSRHTFPLRAFFEDGMADLQKLEKSEEVVAYIASLQSLLDAKDVVWCESILNALGLTNIGDLYSDVISDALDQFPSLNEASNKSAIGGGIPILIKPLQCEVRFPVSGSKVINVTMGVFRAKKVPKEDGTFEYVSYGDPNQVKLDFLDDAGLAARSAEDKRLADSLLNLKNNLKAPNLSEEQKVQIANSIQATENEIKLRSLSEIGAMRDLLSKPAVADSLPVLLMAILSSLKDLIWPDLDMGKTQQRLVAALSKIIPGQNQGGSEGQGVDQGSVDPS